MYMFEHRALVLLIVLYAAAPIWLWILAAALAKSRQHKFERDALKVSRDYYKDQLTDVCDEVLELRQALKLMAIRADANPRPERVLEFSELP